MKPNEKHFYGSSGAQIKKDIDNFLAVGDPFKALDLALPVSGARKFKYRGLIVREWHNDGNVRFDSFVDLSGSGA